MMGQILSTLFSLVRFDVNLTKAKQEAFFQARSQKDVDTSTAAANQMLH
jgi:hypothetical protein